MTDDRTDRRHFVAVAAVVVVALVLTGGYVASSYVGTLGRPVQPTVQVDADVVTDPSNETGEPGTVTVTWTGNGPTPEQGLLGGAEDDRRTDYLEVSWAEGNGTALDDETDFGHGERTIEVTDGTWRLGEVGHAVTLTERNATAATAVRLRVTGVDEGEELVVYATTVTI